jgi:hypothetical protein
MEKILWRRKNKCLLFWGKDLGGQRKDGCWWIELYLFQESGWLPAVPGHTAAGHNLNIFKR